MAVIPGGSHPVPDGAKQTGADLALIQNLTEADVRNQIKGQALLPWQAAHGSFFTNIIGGIGKAIWNGVNGFVNTIGSWAGIFHQAGTQIRDGQIDLNDRTDLLSPLLDYRSVSTPPSSSDAMHGSGRIPFDFQIGPFQGVSKEPSMLILDDKGLWDLRAQVTASYMNNPLAQKIKVWLRVLRPDGSIFSQQAHYAETMNSITIPIVSSACVPSAGYKVDVWVWSQSGSRGWWSGPEWTRLTVQHISREVENGTGGESSTIPTEPEAEG